MSFSKRSHTPMPGMISPSVVRRTATSKSAMPGIMKRAISSPNVRDLIELDTSTMSSAEKKRNKLRYHRTAVTCVNCRRRKIRCIIATDKSTTQCQNCIRLKKDCQYDPVDQQPAPRTMNRSPSEEFSGYSKRPSTLSTSSRHEAPASESSSTAGTIPCSFEGCDWQSKTQSEHIRHGAGHGFKHLCTVGDCGRNGKGFATINDLNRHLQTVHGRLVSGGRWYRCFAAGCSKPEKEWPRKDNFRSHLKKAHPDEDMEELLRQSEAWWDSQQQENAKTSRPSLPYNLEEAGSQIRSQEYNFIAGSKRNYKSYWDTKDVKLSNSSVAVSKSIYPAWQDIRDFHVPKLTTSSQHDDNDDAFLDEGLLAIPMSPRHLAPGCGTPVTHLSQVKASGAWDAWDFPLRSSSEPLASAVPAGTTSKASKPYAVIPSSGTPGSDTPKEYLVQRSVSQPPCPLSETNFCSDPTPVELEQPAMLRHAGPSKDVKDLRDDDYYETSVDAAGKTVFLCKWPTCANKRLYNLRSEVKKHVKHHLKVRYGCTFDRCYRRFGRVSDWIRHELKRHTEQDYWRCDLEHPTSPHVRNCDEVFSERKQFFAHLEELHQVTELQQINKLADSKLIDAGFQDFIDRERGSSDSEESTSSYDESSEFSESGITVGDNPSSIQRRRAVRVSRERLWLSAVNAEYASAIASLSKASRNPRILSPLPPRHRSTSQSSKVGSYDSEAEREFMGSAIDCGTISGLSPRFAAPGDHDFITSIVIELVQAYLQTLDDPHGSLRQCADGSDASQSQRTANDSSGLSISRNSAPKGTARYCKRAGQEDDDDDLEEQDNPVKRVKLEIDAGENKSFACPYSKYERARYSEMNTNTCEKKYRRCASSYLTDIPRLKQHLFRTHKRPDLYCGRCFGIFKTQHDLEEHSRVHSPCPLGDCPFPEKMTHDQRTIIQRRRDLKDQVLVWFYIYETLFPGSIKPSSPYVEVVSVEAAASFQQWYESPEIIANFHERFCSRIAETFPDTSDQFLIQMIHEECLSELASQRGPNFHIDKGEESNVENLELPGFLPNSSGTGPSFETAGSMSYIGAHAATNSLGMPLHQNDVTEPQFAFLASGVGPSCTGHNGTDARVQESLPTLGASSRSPSDTFEELEKLPPHDHLRDQYDFSMTDHYSSDFPGISGNGILTIDASDAEDFHAADMDDQTEDDLSRKQRGKRRAYN